jgi:hypothetical protein
MVCHNCGQPVDTRERIGRSARCPGCGKDLRVCLNCRFYEPGAHWDCRETIPEPVREKDRGTFCDYFSPASDRKPSGSSEPEHKARSQFDRLFGDG